MHPASALLKQQGIGRMNVQPKIRFAALFLAVAFLFCSTTALNAPRPSNLVPRLDEQFDRKLMSITSVSEAVDYVKLSAEGSSEKQLLQAADQFVRQRFYHGYSTFAPADNWLAYMAGYVWDDLRYPVIPDDILKHRQAACSQQAIVFQAIARRLGFTVGSIAFTDPGHFASAVKVNGSWFYFDPNREIAGVNVPLHAVISGSALYGLYGALGRNWTYAGENGEISLRDVNGNPAPQATFFHQITSLFSSYGWLIFSTLFVIAPTRRTQVGAVAAKRHSATSGSRLRPMIEILCMMFGHSRSRRGARFVAGTWRSDCRLCETPLIRLRHGQWIPTTHLRQHAEALLGPTFELTWPADGICFSELIQEMEEAASANLQSVPSPACTDVLTLTTPQAASSADQDAQADAERMAA